eukprot:GHVL01023612.1.p1 GENE.GHVL01023612.1~~GHVL01023612.1.p1  ORF type:complete len:649 (+),score=185.20 GHVL01023612.1:69-2015(+)
MLKRTGSFTDAFNVTTSDVVSPPLHIDISPHNPSGAASTILDNSPDPILLKCRDTIERLWREVEDERDTRVRLEEQQEENEKRITQITSELQTTKDDMEEQQNRFKEWKSKAEEDFMDVQNIEDELEEAKDSIRDLTEQLKDSNNNLSIKCKEVTDLRAKMARNDGLNSAESEKLLLDFETSQKQLGLVEGQLKTEKNRRLDENQRLTGRIEELTKTNLLLESTLLDLQNQYKDMEKCALDAERRVTLAEDTIRGRISDGDLKKLKDENNKLVSKNIKLEESNVLLVDEKREMSSKAQSDLKEHKMLLDQMKESSLENDHLTNLLKKEREEFQNEKYSFDEKLKKTYMETKNLQKKLNDLNCESVNTQKQLTESNREIAKMQIRLTDSNQETLKIENQMTDLKREMLVVQTKLTDSIKENDKLKHQLCKYQRGEEDSIELLDKLNMMTREKTLNQTRIATLEGAIRGHESEISDLQNEVAHYIRIVSAKNTSFTEQTSQIAAYDTEMDSLKIQLARYRREDQISQSKLDRLRSKYESKLCKLQKQLTDRQNYETRLKEILDAELTSLNTWKYEIKEWGDSNRKNRDEDVVKWKDFFADQMQQVTFRVEKRLMSYLGGSDDIQAALGYPSPRRSSNNIEHNNSQNRHNK